MSWLTKVGALSPLGGLSQMVDTHHQMLLRGAAGLTPESSAAYYPGLADVGPSVGTHTGSAAHANPERIRR